MQIELVCQNDGQPSFWRDVVPAGQSGLHHMALYCQNYDADLAAYTDAGIEVAFSGLMMGNRVCWVDTRAQLGFMIELIEANEVAASVFAQFRAAAQHWDGRDPVRTMGCVVPDLLPHASCGRTRRPTALRGFRLGSEGR